MEGSRDVGCGKLEKKVTQENEPVTHLVSFFVLVLNTNLLLLYIKVVNYKIHDREGGYKENNTRDSISFRP